VLPSNVNYFAEATVIFNVKANYKLRNPISEIKAEIGNNVNKGKTADA
jgi:hypothetical protein